MVLWKRLNTETPQHENRPKKMETSPKYNFLRPFPVFTNPSNLFSPNHQFPSLEGWCRFECYFLCCLNVVIHSRNLKNSMIDVRFTIFLTSRLWSPEIKLLVLSNTGLHMSTLKALKGDRYLI